MLVDLALSGLQLALVLPSLPGPAPVQAPTESTQLRNRPAHKAFTHSFEDCTLKGNSSMSVLSGKSVAILATDGFEQSELLVRGRPSEGRTI